MSQVGIVVDSTCDIGPEWLRDNGVTMVPLTVLFAEDSYRDWVELEPAAFYRMLAASPVLPKTSQPSPADFIAAYTGLARTGCTEIVSIHLSSALSGTFESAMLASGESPVPVRVVDTKLLTQGTALSVKAAISERDRGGDAAAVEAAALVTARDTRVLFVLDTLEYLVKGGRAGKATGLAASLLNIKPILTLGADGIIEPYKKVKGLRRAMAEIASEVARASAVDPVDLILMSADESELVDELRALLDEADARYTLDSVGHVGAVIGVYGGPRSVGVAFCPSR